jgi:Flp pilus assembly protein TadG
MFGIEQWFYRKPGLGTKWAEGVFRRARVAATPGESGSALVEMALVTPIILLLMTGMFSLSMVTFQKLQLAEAVNTGARYLAVARGDADPCATTANVLYSAAPTLSKSKLTLSFVLNGTSYSGATCTAGAANMLAGKTAKLTATYPCILKWYKMGPASCTLSVSTSEVIQ